jgi:hypothetical protein
MVDMICQKAYELLMSVWSFIQQFDRFDKFGRVNGKRPKNDIK